MNENIWKRVEIVRRLLAIDLIKKDVLEIGVGLGAAALSVTAALSGYWNYKGTDLSEKNCKFVENYSGLDVVRADIVDLPFKDKSFDVVIALDVLEHVEHKERGYNEISRVLKDWGRVVLNIPLSISYHAKEQEFGFNTEDLYKLLITCKMEMEKYEVYSVTQGRTTRHYAWAVGVR
jgi:ubiquinone/menaquinone biosynthesis C-methylase UbiE